MRQVDVADDAVGLTLAPFDPAVWVAEHDGHADDPDEERAELGKGAFATTLRMATPEGLLVAVKRIQQRDMRKAGLSLEAMLTEAETLRSLQHPHVVRYIGVASTRRHFLLVMELAAGGSLARRVGCRPPPRSEEVERWGLQLAAALEHIHWRGVIHRDLKNDNVLLSSQVAAHNLLCPIGFYQCISPSITQLLDCRFVELFAD